MRAFALSELRWLVDRHEPPCVSVFLDLHGAPKRNHAPHTRLARLLREAERLLVTRHPHAEAHRLLEPISTLPARLGRKRASIAMFRSPDVLARYVIPARLPDLVVVATTFHTRPLVTYLNSERRFFVLWLRSGGARLFAGTPRGLAELDEDVYPDFPRSALARPGARAPRAETWRAVDAALAFFLKDDRAPLVLAGPPSRRAAYRAVATSGPEPLERGIDTGAGNASLRSIHARALALVDEDAALVTGELLAQVAASSGPASFDLAAIAHGAAAGRVRAFVHALDVQVWGRLDRATGEIVVHDRQRDAADADLLDDIAELVLLRGGDVFAVEGARIPGGFAAAALYA